MSVEVDDTCCKVGRAIQLCDLYEFNNELRNRRDRGDSLRDLATFTNTRILEWSLAGANVNIVGDVETLYHILTDNDIRTSRRAEAKSQLENQGISVSEILDTFVSHTTMRQHLQECLNIDTSQSQQVDPDAEQGTIEWARARSEQVIEESLTRLQSANVLEAGELDVTHSVRVTCNACGTSYRLHKLLEEGHCACANQ